MEKPVVPCWERKWRSLAAVFSGRQSLPPPVEGPHLSIGVALRGGIERSQLRDRGVGRYCSTSGCLASVDKKERFTRHYNLASDCILISARRVPASRSRSKKRGVDPQLRWAKLNPLVSSVLLPIISVVGGILTGQKGQKVLCLCSIFLHSRLTRPSRRKPVFLSFYRFLFSPPVTRVCGPRRWSPFR